MYRFFYTQGKGRTCLHVLDQGIFLAPSAEPVYPEQLNTAHLVALEFWCPIFDHALGAFKSFRISMTLQ